MSKIRKVTLVTLAALSVGSGAAQAQLVSNGNFEINGGDWSQSVTDWSASGGTAWLVLSADTLTSVQNGDYALAFNGATSGTSLSQSIATTAGQSYTLSFWWSIQQDANSSQLTASWNGVNLLSQSNAPMTGWEYFTTTVTALGTSSILSFGGSNEYGFTAVDDVSLQTVAAVPEPSTFGMMLLGLTGLGLLARRKTLCA